MAEDNQETTTSEQQQPDVWDAAQYEAALAHLERLQEQLDNLRSTIPSLVAPIVRPKTSKTQLFAEIRKSAVQSTDDLKDFRERWNSEQTQQLFARSNQSLEQNANLGKAMDVAKYGWSEQ